MRAFRPASPAPTIVRRIRHFQHVRHMRRGRRVEDRDVLFVAMQIENGRDQISRIDDQPRAGLQIDLDAERRSERFDRRDQLADVVTRLC